MENPDPAADGDDLTTARLAAVGVHTLLDPARTASGDSRSFDPADSPADPPSDEQATPLFSAEEAADFLESWNTIQVSFVDAPREAVKQADGLVAATMQRQAVMFAEARARLENQWDTGGHVSTEDLRLAMRRYRSFFGRLLTN